MEAVERNHTEQLLLNALQHAAHADCQVGAALLKAASGGHTEIVHRLIEAPQPTTPADCWSSEALVEAVRGGHVCALQHFSASFLNLDLVAWLQSKRLL